MSVESINEVIRKAQSRIVGEKIDKADIKSKAKIVKSTIKDIALESNVNMD